jgi:HK97 family phage major capsid protein
MKTIKKTDGTIAEVEDSYTLTDGEEFVADSTDKSDEEVKNELKSFIKAETSESFDKMMEAKADELVNKFMTGVESARIKAFAPSMKKAKKTTDQDIVRKWFNALVNHDGSMLREVQKDYMSETEDTDGGYLVPPMLVAEVNRFVSEYGVARKDMRYLPFSGAGNSRNIPALDSSVSVFWPDEAGVKNSTKPSFKLVAQTLKKIAAIVPLTEELVADSGIDIIALLGELIGEAIAMEEDRVYLSGSTIAGDPVNGVLYATGVVPVAMGAGDVAADIDPTDLNNLIYAVPKEVRRNGKFYLNSTIIKRIQNKKATDGHFIWQAPAGDQPGSIWGRPYEEVDILPGDDLETEETPFAFYTDLKKTCVYGDKGGLNVKLLDQAVVKSASESPSDLNLATQDMVAVRVVKRSSYAPVLPAGIAVLKTGAES